MAKGHESRLEVMASDDKISDIPNSVFEKILSLVPTKQAITTCLSSKGWINLRLSLPSLDFDEFNFQSLHSLLQYVDTVMRMRYDSETLKMLHLILRSTLPSREQRIQIKTLINTSILHSKADHVEIHDKSPHKFKINIPSCIFNCKTITILKLSGVKVKIIPSFVDLPSLEVLHLNVVIFPNIDCAYSLLYGCPSLQELSLKYCYARYLHGRSIGSLKEVSLREFVPPDVSHYPFTLKDRLKNLVSADVYFYPFTLESLSNVTTLRINETPDRRAFYNLIHLEIR